MNFIDIPLFINEHITKRSESLFAKDIKLNQSVLSTKISGKSVLVIVVPEQLDHPILKQFLNLTLKSYTLSIQMKTD